MSNVFEMIYFMSGWT